MRKAIYTIFGLAALGLLSVSVSDRIREYKTPTLQLRNAKVRKIKHYHRTGGDLGIGSQGRMISLTGYDKEIDFPSDINMNNIEEGDNVDIEARKSFTFLTEDDHLDGLKISEHNEDN